MATDNALELFGDVKLVLNHVKVLAWCMKAAGVFVRRPSIKELDTLVQQGAKLSGTSVLTNTLRTLKGLLTRFKRFESTVFEFLKPIPGCQTNFCTVRLQALAEEERLMTFRSSLGDRIATVLDDSGRRHCLCGGPSDGRFMIGCDGCDVWFHGHCVGVSKDTPEEQLENWMCPNCTKSTVKLSLDLFHQYYDIVDEVTDNDVAPLAVKPDDMWPPLGLLYSDRALRALGPDCCAMPDIPQIVSIATDLLRPERDEVPIVPKSANENGATAGQAPDMQVSYGTAEPLHSTDEKSTSNP